MRDEYLDGMLFIFSHVKHKPFSFFLSPGHAAKESGNQAKQVHDGSAWLAAAPNG